LLIGLSTLKGDVTVFYWEVRSFIRLWIIAYFY